MATLGAYWDIYRDTSQRGKAQHKLCKSTATPNEKAGVGWLVRIVTCLKAGATARRNVIRRLLTRGRRESWIAFVWDKFAGKEVKCVDLSENGVVVLQPDGNEALSVGHYRGQQM